MTDLESLPISHQIHREKQKFKEFITQNPNNNFWPTKQQNKHK